MNSEERERTLVLLGDLRQLASDILSLEHQNTANLPEVSSDQYRDMQTGRDALNEIYWQMFGSERR